MKSRTPRSVFAFVIAAALAGVSTNASAADIEFRFHASELSSPEALYARMAARAKAACERPGRQPLRSIKAEDACEAVLLDDFVAGAGSSALTAVHAEEANARLAALR
ncbi:MAG: UrcA family protein [Parvularculaceae bacterium]|nr:UrcA family protein [Parvularculaceae bacterium]